MSHDELLRPMTDSMPPTILASGYFVEIDGVEYISMVWSDGSATVQVAPGEDLPGPGFETDDSGWSRRVYGGNELDRVFHRDTNVAWRNCVWSVRKVYSNSRGFDCRFVDGYTRIAELLQDDRVTRGDDRMDIWAELTVDEIDGIIVAETEVRKGVQVASTRRIIHRWSRG